MSVKRFIAIGALLGVFVGVIITFLFPSLLIFGAQFNSASNAQLGLPNYFPKSGSILNSLMVAPMFLGIVGSVLGFIIYKLKRSK
jgi:hypothetical protein